MGHHKYSVIIIYAEAAQNCPLYDSMYRCRETIASAIVSPDIGGGGGGTVLLVEER